MSVDRGKIRLSLTAQVMILVLSTVITAQGVTILAVFLLPPSPPPIYSFVQVAAALKGESLASDQGRRLRRSVATNLPTELRRQTDPSLSRLAQVMGSPEERIRLVRRGPPPFFMLNLGPPLRFPGAGPGFGGPPGKLPLDFRPPGLEIFRPPGLEMLTLRGEFAAAWRRPDEKWAIVEPEPDLEWIRRAIVWVGGGLLIMGPIGFWFAQRISAPLRGFAASAETLGRDPQASPIAPSGPAEIGVAARAFNAMQTRLQRYVADRVSMIGAISHDLRTPLTRIRFKLEKVEPALRTAVLSDVRQMEHMIDGVIAFNQDHATPSVRQRLDLVSLVISTADEAATGGADVCATFAPPLVVDGDAVGLQRLFANLIDNAVKYGARVEVFFAERDGAAVVTIIDDGPGLPQRELERVFTPFYRTEAARQEQSTGVGLGLSIARAVARSHGGDVVLRSGARGLIAEVVLPRAVG